MKHLLPHMPVVAPSAHRFARQLSVSANADVLLFYFGWLLRIPLLGRLVLRLPVMPRLAAYLATRLPSRLVRGKNPKPNQCPNPNPTLTPTPALTLSRRTSTSSTSS